MVKIKPPIFRIRRANPVLTKKPFKCIQTWTRRNKNEVQTSRPRNRFEAKPYFPFLWEPEPQPEPKPVLRWGFNKHVTHRLLNDLSNVDENIKEKACDNLMWFVSQQMKLELKPLFYTQQETYGFNSTL